MNRVKLVRVNCKNYKVAIDIQHAVFVNKNGQEDIIQSLTMGKAGTKHFCYLKYFLIKVKKHYVGLCGLYAYHDYPKDAWFAWLAVLPEYRKHGYGSFAINQMIKLAKKEKFQNVRLYTDDALFKDACKLYDKFFDSKEEYRLESGKYYAKGKTIIYSKSLTQNPVEKWGNNCLYLADHEEDNVINKGENKINE